MASHVRRPGAVCAALGGILCAAPAIGGVSFDLYSTGIAPDGVTLLPGGAPDPHYDVIFAPFPFIPGLPAMTISSRPASWVADTPTSQWVNVDGLGGFSSEFHPGGTYVYETNFDLTGLDPTTVAISLEWAADDNTVVDGVIGINGFLVPSSGTGPGPGSWTGFTAISFGAATAGLGAAFLPGMNSLTFTVTNDQSLPGVFTGPTGLHVNIISATADLIPAPGSAAALALALAVAARRRR